MSDDAPGVPVTTAPPARWRALWSALDAAATPVSMLVLLAGLVRALSAADYGLLVMALAAAGISLALSPAIAMTTTKFVSEVAHRGIDRAAAVGGVVASALAAVTMLDAGLLAATAAWREPLAAWVFGPVGPDQPRGDILLLAMGTVALQQLDAVLAAAIRGLERFRRQALLEIAARASVAAIVTAVAWRTGDLRDVLGAQCAVTAVFVGVRALSLRALLPGGRLLARPTRTNVVRLFRFGGWMGLAAVSGIAYTSVDRLVVGHFLGAASAGRYAIEVQVTQLIHFVPASLFAFALPAFSRLGAVAANGTAEPGQLRRLFIAYQGALSAGAVALAAAIVAAWPLALRALGGAAFAAGHARLDADVLLLAVNFLVLAVSVLSYYLLLALGGSRTVSLVTTGGAIVSLILMAELIPTWGLSGAAASRLPYALASLALLGFARSRLGARPH